MEGFNELLTVILVWSVAPQLPLIVYDMVCVPIPAIDGSNVPMLGSVIPFPDQIPPP